MKITLYNGNLSCTANFTEIGKADIWGGKFAIIGKTSDGCRTCLYETSNFGSTPEDKEIRDEVWTAFEEAWKYGKKSFAFPKQGERYKDLQSGSRLFTFKM